MTRRGMVFLLVLTCLMALPGVALAQIALQRVEKDTSGGVLPGVLMEATSPALIEGTKATTTDDSGNFRIVDLRPGVYTIAFTLSGFQSVKVEQVELSAEQTLT